MKSWLVLKSPHRPIDVVDAETADEACVKVARKRNEPGRYMAVEWNPVITRVSRNLSESWGVVA